MDAGHKPVIFVFTTAYYPLIGGAEIAIREVARRLAGEFRFFILTARMRRDLPRREARPEGIVIRVGFGGGLDKWLFPFLGPFVARRELRRLGTNKALLWGMDISTGSLAAALMNRARPGMPFMLTVQYGYGGGRLAGGRFGLIGRAYRFMLRRADAVTAISNFLANTAKEYGYERLVEVIPNGASLEWFHHKRDHFTDPEHPVVITTSRLVLKNGVDILIRAIAEIRKSIPGIRCHILGDGPERFLLEVLTRDLGLSEHVRFFGNIPNIDAPRYFAAADVFCRPSRSEGLGISFLEAMAIGVPIVATSVEGITDFLVDGDTGLICEVDNPSDCAVKILTLIRNQDLSRRIIANARDLAEKRFSWENIAKRFGNLFHYLSLRRVPLRILIATPMFPPDIGGPGGYAKNLAERLSVKGCKVSILSYGQNFARFTRLNLVNLANNNRQSIKGIALNTVSLRLPYLARQIYYFWLAFRFLAKSDIALALDPIGVGAPLALACRLCAKPMIVRLEGDRLWESYLERGGEELTLRQFYERFFQERLNREERWLYKIARWVFVRADRVVFSSEWRKSIFSLGYPLRPEQAAIIDSPWPKIGSGKTERSRMLIFAGRFVRVKNLPRLIRAFLAVSSKQWRLELVGDGPQKPEIEKIILESGAGDRIALIPSMPHSELMKRIASAHAFLLPSLSDVSPNVILDCIAVGTPFLLTRETGFYEMLKNAGLFADPKDEADIAAMLRELLDPGFYAVYRERTAHFNRNRSWDDVAEDWLIIIRTCL